MSKQKIRILDISRSIGKGEVIYPGNPVPILKRIRNFKKDKSSLSVLSLGLHTASHLDAPLHYLQKGKEVEKVNLENCLGWCRVCDFTKIKNEIGEKEIKRIKPLAGEIILLKTKNSFGANRFNSKFIHLNRAAADFLVKSKIKAVGTDGPSIRKFRLKPDDVHPRFLTAGVLIYEGLNLREAKAGRYYFMGLPLKIKSAEASPVRAVLIKD